MTKSQYRQIKKDLTKGERQQIDAVLKDYGTDIQPDEDIIDYLDAEDVDYELIEKLKDL